MLSVKYHLPVTSPGSILRAEKRAGTPLGLEAGALTSQGQLAPDEMVNEVVRQWLERRDGVFVFDGYPRSLGQASKLDEMLAARGTPLEAVISLEADEATILGRVAQRLTCMQCEATTRADAAGSSAEICPRCGGSLVRRDDDTPGTLALRLAEFHRKTKPLLDYYEPSGLLHPVDAGRPREDVFHSIEALLTA